MDDLTGSDTERKTRRWRRRLARWRPRGRQVTARLRKSFLYE
jgi:hypothetical protein